MARGWAWSGLKDLFRRVLVSRFVTAYPSAKETVTTTMSRAAASARAIGPA